MQRETETESETEGQKHRLATTEAYTTEENETK